jgi:FkbM family methyltransferase
MDGAPPEDELLVEAAQGDPVLPADLARWKQGPLSADARDFHTAKVGSLVGNYSLSIAAFDGKEDKMISGELLAGNGWETNRVTKLCRLYRENGAVGNFLDVGANIGTYTMPLADCLRGSGRVFSVEGMPPTADHLVEGIRENKLDNVDVYTYAVGAPSDPRNVTLCFNPVNKGGTTVKGVKPFTEMNDAQLQDLFHPTKKKKQQNRTDKDKVSVREFRVPLTTGDRMLKHNPAMKAIMIAKVDIEGYEGHFLKGSQRLFSKYPPCALTIEMFPEWLESAGTPPIDILVLLDNFGYKDVPTDDGLAKLKTQGRTLTIQQADMEACAARVRKYAVINAGGEDPDEEEARLAAARDEEARLAAESSRPDATERRGLLTRARDILRPPAKAA